MAAILLVSPENWDAHAVSKHHYAKALASLGHKVLFLNPSKPSSIALSFRCCDNYSNIYIVDTPIVAKGLRFMPSFLRRMFECRWLRSLEELVNFPIDIIWLFENSRFFDLSFAGNRLKIYHQVDLNQNFQPAFAAKTADICFGISDFILDYLSPYNSCLYKVAHGYQGALETSQNSNAFDIARAGNTSSLQALYVGNLDILYLDHELIALLVKSFPSVCFNFVGGYSSGNSLLALSRQHSNLVLHGKVSSERVPMLLEQADLLLIVYLADQYKEQLANPHKLMEYLGSGKTVVATYTHEYRALDDLLLMVESNDDYIQAFQAAVDRIDFYNSSELAARRKTYANEYSYENQLLKINHHLADSGLDPFIFPKDDT